MKLTVAARVAPDLQSRLRARTERQKAAIRAVNLEEAPQMRDAVKPLVPVDTAWMVNHTDFAITNDGYGFEVGWYDRDFTGQTNPVNNQLITAFYPLYVTLGTRLMAGRDALTPTLETRWPQLRQRYLKALSQ